MFKPNVRGLGKHDLRLELAGWRNRVDNSLIKHRYPWRRSWPEQVSRDASLSPVMARSGQVLLVQNASQVATKSNHANFQTKPRRSLQVGVISGIAGVAVLLLVPTSTTNKVAVVEVKKVPAAFDCKEYLQNPVREITMWLNGSGVDEIEIEEIDRQELGGVQFRQINTLCGNNRAGFQITLTQRDQVWHLKKFTRLED